MNEKIKNIINKEIQINSCLESIEEPSKVATGYIKEEIDLNDVNELIAALECITSYCDDIRNLVSELVYEFKNEIEESENECI